MGKPIHVLAVLVALTGISSCGTYPKGRVEQGATATGIYFLGPAEAQVRVDGADVGPAASHADINSFLPLPAGLHHVTMQSGGRVVFDRDLYVGSGSRVLVRAQ